MRFFKKITYNLFLIILTTLLSIILFQKNTYILTKEKNFINNENINAVSSLNFTNVRFPDKNYVNNLNKDQILFFYDLYDGILNYKESFEIPNNINDKDFSQILFCLLYDCPELFQLDSSYKKIVDINNNMVKFIPKYKINKEQYLSMMNFIDIKYNEIIKNINLNNYDDYEKELFFHDYLIQNVDYDKDIDNCDNIFGALINGKANCEGYSSAFTYLLRKNNINCGQIIGKYIDEKTSKETGHSWNFIVLNDNYYFTDVGWDDINKTLPSHAYFNLTYKNMMKHRNLDIQKHYSIKSLFNDDNSNCIDQNYYFKNKLYLNNINEVKNKFAFLENELKNKGYFEFFVSDDKIYKEVLDLYRLWITPNIGKYSIIYYDNVNVIYIIK